MPDDIVKGTGVDFDTEFDPEGSGYDYTQAILGGLSRGADGHWPSRNPFTGQLLKGRTHPTWDLLEQGEKAAGMEIFQGTDKRWYSRPIITNE